MRILGLKGLTLSITLRGKAVVFNRFLNSRDVFSAVCCRVTHDRQPYGIFLFFKTVISNENKQTNKQMMFGSISTKTHYLD